MELDATIVGTHEGYYLACIDEEREGYDCIEECYSCPYPCRILLEKEQPIEKGRKVRAYIKEPLIHQPRKLFAVLASIYIIIFIIMLAFIKGTLSHYRSYLPVIMSGFFGSAAFYLILKIREEKKGERENLRKGQILRVYLTDR
jgi:hypothetical protein